MANNQKIKSVDDIMKELDFIFKINYLGYKKINKPYKEILQKLKGYRGRSNSEDILYAIQDKIEGQETFMNLESNLWGSIFIILGLSITVVTDVILSNYEVIPILNEIPRLHLIGGFVAFIALEVVLYCISIMGHARRKNKEKCYYKLAYSILSAEMGKK